MNNLTPKKRLCSDSGERFTKPWECFSVEDLYDVGSSKRVLQSDWSTSGIPFYRTRELVCLRDGKPLSEPIFISPELYSDLKEKYGVPQVGDFLVSGVGTLGVFFLVKDSKPFYYKDGNVLHFKDKGFVDPAFMSQMFTSNIIKKQIEAQTATTTVGTFTIKNAKQIQVNLPSIEEQRKIASLLLTWEKAINAYDRLIALKEKQKRGLMQDLLLNSDYPEIKLGEIACFVKGKGLSKKALSEEGVPCVHYGQLFTTYGAHIDNVFSRTSNPPSKPVLSKLGDVLVPTSCETPIDLATASMLPLSDVVLGGDILIIRPDREVISPLYLSYYINSSKKQILGLATGTTVFHIYAKDMEKLLVKLPSIEIQERITSCLLSVDRIIQALSQKRDLLKMQKQGLMQQLLA